MNQKGAENMKTIYLAWESPPCDGATPRLQEISGKEFYGIVSTGSKDRYFIKLPSEFGDAADRAIIMETTKADYLEWRREKNHADYLWKYRKPIRIFSYHALESKDGECFGEEMLRDENCDVWEEAYVLHLRTEIRAAISRLDPKERAFIEDFFLSGKQCTEREYSELTGIPQKTINDRKKRAFAKLKKILS
jgi:DNA-directed RNA polymerase specialized sigma subunit